MVSSIIVNSGREPEFGMYYVDFHSTVYVKGSKDITDSLSSLRGCFCQEENIISKENMC